MTKFVCSIFLVIMLTANAIAQQPESVFLEELTWTEIRSAIDTGTTTVIVPTAGTEQNGPHMALGKHRYRMEVGTERIARELGNALVAPVMTYVPEGRIDPPVDHMRYAGTISIPDDIFKSVLEYTARSLKVHGFTDILFIGDSGGNQTGMEEVAEALNQEWDHERTRVHFISDWYSSAVTFRSMLKNQGETDETIGTHAGLYDTSLLLAVAPEHVRTEKMTQGKGMDIDGVIGDPTGASAEIGKIGMDIMHEAAMKQINRLIAEQ